jgi:protein gp37
MADLFGDWVPKDWIDQVLSAVREAPQWNFLFLTKNPKRFIDIDWPRNAWVGTTVDRQRRVKAAEDAFRQIKAQVKFLSCEPLEEFVSFSDLSMFEWIIIGGRSQSLGKPEGQPEWRWVAHLIDQARQYGLKVYMKPNLRPERLREYPVAGGA